MEHISSRQNPLVRHFRAAADAAGDEMLLDGVHLLDEALRSGLEVSAVAVRSDMTAPEVDALARDAASRGARVVSVPGSVFAAMSPVRTPSGIVALARRPPATLDAVFSRTPPFVLILTDVQDPGNLGAIVRAAEGCGATGIVTGPGTADVFGWKALRGSMGSTLRVPVAAHQPIDPAVRAARDRGLRIFAAVPRGGTLLPAAALRGPIAVLLGGEGAGIPDDLVAAADETLTIPMQPPVESLNVAIAAALIAYERMRQQIAVQS